MIEINNIRFGYTRDRLVLDGVSLKIDKGEVLSIVGASGAGKSTLLRIIAGVLNQGNSDFFHGTVDIAGKNTDEVLKEGKLAFMFQEPSLFPNLNVWENVALPLQIKKSLNRDKVDALISAVGLKGFENYLPKALSGGMKTRVALARSFVTEPEILLLDEPFSALDIGWKQILIQELIEIKKKTGTTIIMVTHDIQEAICLSNRFIVLGRNGKVLDEHTLGNRQVKDNGYLDITRVPKYFPADLSRIQTILSLDSEKEERSFNEIEAVLDLFLLYAGDNAHLDFYENMKPILQKYFRNRPSEALFISKIDGINEKATKKQKEIIENVLVS